MFNKNRKRLLSAFIAAMMLCPVTTNGMENNYNYKVITVNNYKVGVIPEFKSQGKAYIREFQGYALNNLFEKYGFDVNDDKIFAGNSGVISQYIFNNGFVAVKCVVNPKIMKTCNNQTNHVEDYKNESKFYDESKTLWKDKPWALKMYDLFHEDNDNVYYLVTEWVDGITLDAWIKNLFENKNDIVVIMKSLLPMIIQFININTDMYNQNRCNDDLHFDNLMVSNQEQNIQLRVVDNGHYIEITDKKKLLNVVKFNVWRMLQGVIDSIKNKYGKDISEHCDSDPLEKAKVEVKECDDCLRSCIKISNDLTESLEELKSVIDNIKNFIIKYDKKNI